MIPCGSTDRVHGAMSRLKPLSVARSLDELRAKSALSHQPRLKCAKYAASIAGWELGLGGCGRWEWG